MARACMTHPILKPSRKARFKTIRDITHAQEPQHKALYTATDGPASL